MASESVLEQLKDLGTSYSPEDALLSECTRLDLSSKSLVAFPPGILLLTRLRSLRLDWNKITALPPDISTLADLEDLWLTGNHLSSLPPQISTLRKLTGIWITANKLSSLPNEMSYLTKLTFLAVNGNSIYELPVWLTALKDLRQIFITSGKDCIKRAPRGITNLPVWNNKINSDYTNIRRLVLYDENEVLASIPNAIEELTTPIKAQKIHRSPSGSQPSSVDGHIFDQNSEPVVGDYADVMDAEFGSDSVIGEGGHGMVYKVQLQKGIVAVKVLKAKARPNTPEYEDLVKEARLLVGLAHENIITLYSYGCKNRQILYVMEFADGGSLWDLLRRNGPLSIMCSVIHSIQIACGLAYLHSRSPPVEHRDLKPENIVLCDGVAKLSDFGISTARETVSRSTGFAGTLYYAAPEAFGCTTHGPMTDVYSFGLVIWAMVSGKRPYDGATHSQIIAQKLSKTTPVIPPPCPVEVVRIMSECWDMDPNNRPTAANISTRLRAFVSSTQSPSAVPVANPTPVALQVPVVLMNTAQLVQCLRDQNLHPDFLAAVRDHDVSGEDLVCFTEKDLVSAPFNLSKFQAKFVLRFVQQLKQS